MDDRNKKKRIAIIGAGATGITSIVALREVDLDPVCFEASDRYGGLWNYRDESIVGFGSLMPTTVLNHSKEMGAISNCPPGKEYNNYMRHQEVFQILTEYYKRNDCQRYIRFNTEVTNVRKSEDYDETGCFWVTVNDKITGEVSTDIYYGVMVCTGHFNYPKMEKFPGQENFQGEVIHTHSLKDVDKYKGKNVLVVGAGCSGLDAAECVSYVAKQVYLSTRSGMLVLNRVGPNGYPIDYVTMRRYLLTWLNYLPTSWVSRFIEKKFIDPKFDRSLYTVKPKYHVLAKDPVLNDAIATKLLTGFVIQKGAIKRFVENGVIFDGENTVTNVDDVIMATGYTFKFPFLEDGLLEIENGRINLYKCMYPVQLHHSSLVFIGFVNPFGPGYPIAELQCRWAAQLFAGNGKLPSQEVMMQDVVKRHRANERRYLPSEYMTVRVDFINYMDEIAEQFGAKPNLLKYLYTDFHLFLKLVFGPCLSYQYRLEGPHKWDGAREAIMTCDERINWPLAKEKQLKKGIFEKIVEKISWLRYLIPWKMLT